MAGAAQPTQPTISRPGTTTLEQVAAAFPQLQVLEMIGQGGMGAVFKVRQPKLDRFAALKLLPQSLAADAAFAGRFEREARMLANFSHPNIVSVYDYGQAGEFFYLLMEYVDGVNLRQAMRASRFEPRQALGIVPKICDALQYAHDEGVLHRDIKPENILLDAKGRVKLVDFGIAKLTAEADSGHADALPTDPQFTQAGAALGTPSYMAPEQREHPSDVDHRADIYSLGVVFYELLTGELPTAGLARPSEKSGADPRVDAIVQQALQKERERRQNSAGEVRTQVETLGSNADAAPTLNYRRASPPRFSRLAILGAVCAAMFVLFSLALYFGPVGSVQLNPLPVGFIALFSTMILGLVSTRRIRKSAGQLRGIRLAVFDGLLFPLLLFDAVILFLSVLGVGSIPHSFWSHFGPLAAKFSILLVTLTASALADTWIIRFVWRFVRNGEQRAKPSPAVPSQPTAPAAAKQVDPPALAIIAIGFYGMAGVLAILAWIRMPNPQQSVVWGILIAGILAVLFAFPVRKTRLGKSALIGGSINVAVWLIIFIVFAVMNGGHSIAAQTNAPSTVDFHYHVFEADSALVDRLIPKSQRSADPLGADSTFQNGISHATGGRGKGDFMVSTKGTTLTDAQIAVITPATLNELLKGIDKAPGLLVDNIFSVSSAFPWPTGMADSWSYSRARDGFAGGGSGSAFLAYRQVDGQDQIHIDCSVDHDIDTLAPGNPTDLNSLLYYEGNVPNGGDIAFLVPFFRKDDSTHYLVVVYQVSAASDQADATTKPSTATTDATPAAVATDEPDLFITALGQVAPPDTTSTTAPAASGRSVVVFFAIPEDYAQEVIDNEAMPAEIYDRSWDAKWGQGVLVGVDNQIDPQTGTLRCKAHVTPIGDALLYPNQVVNVRLRVSSKRHVAPPAWPVAAPSAETEGGRVVERVLEADNPDRRGLNLVTGKFRQVTVSDDGSNRLLIAGADVIYDPRELATAHYLVPFGLGELASSSPPTKTVDDITADEIRQLLAKMQNWLADPEKVARAAGWKMRDPQSLIVGNSLYIFRTHDGLDGALEIVGHSDNPRSIKLRYKLVLDPQNEDERDLEILIQAAQETLAQKQLEYKAGLITNYQLQTSADQVEELKAMAAGDPVAVLEAQLNSALHREDAASQRAAAGLAPKAEYDSAKADAEMVLARLRKAQQVLSTRPAAATQRWDTSPVTAP